MAVSLLIFRNIQVYLLVGDFYSISYSIASIKVLNKKNVFFDIDCFNSNGY